MQIMASGWTVIILATFIIDVYSFTDSFPSDSDFSQSSKSTNTLETHPGINCSSVCKCDSLNFKLFINCRFKNLNVFPTNLHSSVFHLNLVGNNLSKLYYNISFNRLDSLNVSLNNISEIDYHWLSSLKNLKYLDLSKNYLHSKAVENTFHDINLLYLDLSGNELNTTTDAMFSQMSSLTTLNLSFNSIENVSYKSFCDLTSLNTLDMSYNKLADVQHEWLMNVRSLKRLILTHNKLKLLRNVVFSTLKKLEILDLSQNAIKSIGLLSFKGLTNLQFLNISSNNITHFQDGTFRLLESLKVLDLSRNPIVTIDNIFIHMQNLEFLYLKDLNSFKELTPFSLVGGQRLASLDFSGSKKLSDISLKTFLYTQNLKHLDLSNTNLTNLKMGVFKNLKKIETLKLNGNPWRCDCYLYWLLIWLGENSNAHLLSPSGTFCNSPSNLRGQVLLDALDHSMVCTNASIRHYTNKTKFKVGSSALLECKVEGSPLPRLSWITPQKDVFHWVGFQNQTKHVRSLSTISPILSAIFNIGEEQRDRFYLTSNGNLAIQKVERGDGGFYVCIASNPLSYASVSIRLTLDYEYLVHIKIVSVLVGMATSFGFLLLTLISVLIKMILKHFGIKCPCHNGNASPRTQQIKKILESMEHYKKQQLDKLRDNYNGQVQKIKDNCMQQMERLRESYSSQAERIRDIKEYGTLQIDRIRENYYSQVQRVRDYSASQIIRLRENYIYQRNRIRKFSAHHLYKLRENYKVQQQHFNKILENLNIESCRTVCHRTDSVVFEPDITLDNVLVPKICLQALAKETCDSYDNSSQLSAYFTPDEADSEISGHESDEHENSENTTKLKMPDMNLFTNTENKAASTSNIPDIKCEKTVFKQDIIVDGKTPSHETIV